MARKQFQYSTQNPYHITGRVHNRDNFPLPLDEIWTIMSNYLYTSLYWFGVQTHAFVLMPNHFHLLASATDGNLSAAMQYLMRETTRSVHMDINNINQMWGSRFFRCEIQNYNYYMNAYKYIYQNPLRANLCDRVEDYSFSTIKSAFTMSSMVVPIFDHLPSSTGFDEGLAWLNRPITEQNREYMRLALRRKIFSYPKINKNKNHLECELI